MKKTLIVGLIMTATFAFPADVVLGLLTSLTWQAGTTNRVAAWLTTSSLKTVAWYKMDDNAANTTISDSSAGGTRPGTSTANTSTKAIPGKIGGAISFNGSGDSIAIANSSLFNFGASSWTIAWWEYRNSGDNGTSMSRDDNGITAFILGYGIGKNIYMSSGSGWDVASGRSLGGSAVGAWCHNIVRRSGSTFTSFRNNSQVDTWVSSLPLLASTGSLQFGRSQGGTFLKGALDDVRFYDEALTQAEMDEIYNSGNGLTTELTTPRTP